MNTNMIRLRWFSKIFVPLCFGRGSLSIGRVNNVSGSRGVFRLGILYHVAP